MEIRKVLMSEATPGMTTADDVYTESNQLIIPKNTVLTAKIITRLKFYSIYEMNVFAFNQKSELEGLLDEEAEDGINHRISLVELEEFKKVFVSSIVYVREILVQIVMNNEPIKTELIIEEMEEIIRVSRNGTHLLELLHCIRDYDDSTYAHSVKVALLSHIIGEWLGFRKQDIDILTVSGMLHDIGKLKIPENIITKPSKLTPQEYAVIKAHTIHGYNILKNHKIDKRIKQVALMHHERNDGSGYPNEYVDRNIPVFAKIVAIADVYDAMTSNRIYREALCPFYVIELFEKEGVNKYAPQYLIPFLERITNTYINSLVRLSNQEIGKIVMINKRFLSRPVVSIGERFLDLSEYPNISIEGVM